MKIIFYLFMSLIMTSFLTSGKVFAQYQFLGSVVDYKAEGNNLSLNCEGNNTIQLHFLTPSMFRVTLDRDNQKIPLLNIPMLNQNWEKNIFTLQDTPVFLKIRTGKLEIDVQKSPCRITIKDLKGNIINQDDPGMGIGWYGNEVKTWKTITDDEMFFGLGEKAGPLNKRGNEWVLWNTDNPHHDNKSDALYQSVPFYIGMRNKQAYGIYFNNSYKSRFNFGAGNNRYTAFSADGGVLDYFFIYGPDVNNIVREYSLITGRTPMPPLWSLGYQQCRWSYYPEDEVFRIAETFREKSIPADVIYLDIHYMDGYRVFTWDKERFPDPEKMLDKLNKMGFKVIVIIDPGVKVDPQYKIAEEGLAGDHFVKWPDNQTYIGKVWPGDSYFPDFSNPDTRKWWGSKFKEMTEIGIDGFWNDMNEPAVWGRAFPDEVIFYDDGNYSSHKKMHNLYGYLMSQACYEGQIKANPDLRPFVITRAGFAGVQRYSSVWTGDNQATEEHLEMGIRMFQGLGISGIPFIGADVGGFGGTPSPELFIRWIQSAVFTPFFRTHTTNGSNSQEPWSFGEQAENISRKFIEMRYRYLPLLYSLFWEAHNSGAPIIRPLFWHYQDDENVYNPEYSEQFLIGKDILVAPITKVGHYSKKVYFPAGDWLDLNTLSTFKGGKPYLVEASLEQLPYFLRAGAIIPSRDIQQFTGQSPLKELILEIYPADQTGNLLYYEDDGQSFAYKDGKYRTTEYSYSKKDKNILFSAIHLHDEFNSAQKNVTLHFYKTEFSTLNLNDQQLKETDRSGKSQGYNYNPEQQTLTVFIKDTKMPFTLEIKQK